MQQQRAPGWDLPSVHSPKSFLTRVIFTVSSSYNMEKLGAKKEETKSELLF